MIILAVIGIELLLAISSIYNDFVSSVTVGTDTVVFKIGRKEYTYEISKTTFSSSSDNSGNYEIYARSDYFENKNLDCSFLSYTQYYDLIEELGIVGKKQKVIKLETNKK